MTQQFKRLKLDLLKPVPSDYEISRNQVPKHISDVATESGITADELEPYGSYKGKVKLDVLDRLQDRNDGKYVLVAGITPTPLGEGKSTTTVGLAQAIGAVLGKTCFANVRQPSMGPTFGVKGGAAGGGYSQVIPMDEFNMHITGDIHAVGMANNLLAAALDTRMFHEATQPDAGLFKRLCPVKKDGSRDVPIGLTYRIKKLGLDINKMNEWTDEEITKFVRLDVDPKTITWKRVLDLNDRSLRGVSINEAPTEKGLIRKTGFDITVASEVMAILALSNSLKDMRERFGKIVVASSKAGEPITCEDLGCAGALTAIMKDAIKPNLMQTLEGTPVFVHAGPFANISIGASSILADKMALKLAGTPKTLTNADQIKEQQGYVVTEAGFDFTMGGERFLNIKCRTSGLKPNVIVIVATVRALKVHGGGADVKPGIPLPFEYTTENLEMLEKGCINLQKHIKNALCYDVDVIVAINKMSSDTDAEHEIIRKASLEAGATDAIVSNHWEEGGEGAKALAEGVIKCANKEYPSQDASKSFHTLYDLEGSIESKIEKIAQDMYGASSVSFSDIAKEKIKEYTAQGFDKLPICIAKTQYSLSHDAKLKGVPTGFVFPIKDIKASIGAGYLYALADQIMTIPGLATKCGFMNVEVNDQGEIEGLF
jgi:methylenetetrahydrofolate dehydrogenase (NADP+)/methenyltetrahydrofolate cyclohydrolase/formyltetrahydrofolate synthetase